MSLKKLSHNYYFSSFFWSTTAKILNAIFGFFSVPLLLGYFGKAEYGLLSIATACNGYMHIMDLGMNTGAIKYFSQWITEGKADLVNRVARTNISFYLLISVVNSIGLLLLALYGEKFFSINYEQFLQLRICLVILALFSSVSWVTTAFNQLLIADKHFSFTQQVNCFVVILKCVLLYIVLEYKLSLSLYFFLLTLIVSISIFPFSYRCRQKKIIESIRPATYWKDFKIVFLFSLSIFALSLFQVTATQSRPIILSIFAKNGAEAVADYRILEVIPQLIIMIGGTFGSVFLPKTSELITRGCSYEIINYAQKWTTLTTLIVCCLCFPFMLGASEILSAYVGAKYSHLSIWLVMWCAILVIQMHATPCYSLLLSKGKTKMLVYFTALACVMSILINAVLCKYYSCGSAVIGYSLYVIVLMTMYYMFFYKHYLNIPRFSLFFSFLKPVLLAVMVYFVVYLLPLNNAVFFFDSPRINYLEIFTLKSVVWLMLYSLLIKVTCIIK